MPDVRDYLIILLILVVMFIAGISIGKYQYHLYWEVLGDRLADKYYSKIEYFGNDFKDDLKKIKNNDIEDNYEIFEIRKEIYASSYKIDDLVQAYNRTIVSDNKADNLEKFNIYINFFIVDLDPVFNEDEEMVEISCEDSFKTYFEVGKEIEKLVHRHYPVLKEDEYKKEEIVEGGNIFWKSNKWKKVLGEINDHVSIRQGDYLR